MSTAVETSQPPASDKPQKKVQEQTPEQKILSFLKSFHCISPIFPNDFNVVLRINSEATVGEALKKMTDNRVLSLPVVNYHTGKPMWVLSMFDIMAYFVKNCTANDFKHDFYHKFVHMLTDKFKELASKKVSIIEQTADYTLDPVYVVGEHDSLYAAAQLMLSKKIHRVIAVSDSGELSNLITQTRLIQLLAVTADKSPKLTATLKQLDLGMKHVKVVHYKALAFDAFQTMVKEKVSGLAVVDDAGKLYGTISISDFKLCGYEGRFWGLLGMTVQDYLKEIISNPASNIRARVLSWLQSESQPPVVIKCTPNDTLQLVLKFFNFYGIHRIFIVDEQQKPVGVVSMFDVLKELIPIEASQ